MGDIGDAWQDKSSKGTKIEAIHPFGIIGTFPGVSFIHGIGKSDTVAVFPL